MHIPVSIGNQCSEAFIGVIIAYCIVNFSRNFMTILSVGFVFFKVHLGLTILGMFLKILL